MGKHLTTRQRSAIGLLDRRARSPIGSALRKWPPPVGGGDEVSLDQRLGLPDATDMIGGFSAWRREGLPVESLGRSSRRAQRPAGGAVP